MRTARPDVEPTALLSRFVYAYVTLVTNADYALGALALVRSLKAVGSRWPLVVLATENAPCETLEAEGCTILPVAQPRFSGGFRARHARDALHAREPYTKGAKPSFHDPLDNFCKLALWRLTEFERVVFLDADTLVVQNIDKLFCYPEFSAAPNLYDNLTDMHRLNSGVFVAEPDEATYADMLARLDVPEVFWRRTDQTFLESYFPDWHGLPYTYNALQYLYFKFPELWRWSSIKVVHYQFEKPWQADHGRADRLKPLIDLWQTVFDGEPIPSNLADP
ncbi:MAG: glycosyltransferase family 8 protein [Gammaproteobacteria bacterium]|nr:glycosyltransferase family 8 protein [Gammaproteobacteria bacterium]